MPRSRHLTATVALFDPETEAETRTLNETTLAYDGESAPYDTVRGKVQPIQLLSRPPKDAAAGETVHLVVGYLVVIPRRVEAVKVGHRVKVTKTGDTLLDNRSLRVDEVALGLGVGTRLLRCSLID